MPGFVDVSNMSDAEIKRLCQADEEDEPVRNTVRRPSRVQKTIAVRDLAALAFMAQRLNGTLYKDNRVFDEATGDWKTVRANKEIMRENFELNILPTAEDYEQADEAMRGVQGDLTVRVLKGQQVNPFVRSLVELTQEKTASERDCGLMAFLPKTYAGQIRREDKQVQVASLACTSEYLGQVGDKITVDFELVDKRFLQQYGCWSVFGHDGQNNCVAFLTQHENLATSGRIQGKIKRTDEDVYRGSAKVTGLNYVKRI